MVGLTNGTYALRPPLLIHDAQQGTTSCITLVERKTKHRKISQETSTLHQSRRSLVTKKPTMARRIPSAAVAAALLLGTWSADAFQPHARVSSMRPTRMHQNESTVDMISVFGRDVQVRLEIEWDSKAPKTVGRVRGSRYCLHGMAENTDAVGKGEG